MLRFSTAILLSLLILSFGVKELTIYVGFKWNQNIIANQYCVNKDKPKTNCHGKCFLSQQLKEQSVQESENEQTPIISLEIAQVFYTLTPLPFWKAPEFNDTSSHFFSYHSLITRSHQDPLLRPPILA